MISVIIPTYNRGFCVCESIESVLAQSHTDLEVIVVDDNSSDDTKNRVAQLSDQRIRYIRNDKNIGAGASRNAGAQAARGELLAFQDSDDIWLKDKLLLQAHRLEETGADLCFCQFSRMEKVWPDTKYGELIRQNEPYLFRALLIEALIGTPTILVNKQSFDETGCFDASMCCFEDYEFTLRFARKHKICYLDELLCITRMLDSGVNNNMDEKFRARLSLFEKYFTDIKKLGIIPKWVNKMTYISQFCDMKQVVEGFTRIRDIMAIEKASSENPEIKACR